MLGWLSRASIIAHVSFIFILNAILEWISGLRKLPREYLISVRRIRDNCWIIASFIRSSIDASESVFALDFPVVTNRIQFTMNPSKEPLSPWSIPGSVTCLRNRYEILSTGQDEYIVPIVHWNSIRCFATNAGNAQRLSKAKGTVSIACTIAETQFWLESVSAGWKIDGNGEIPCSGE
ncbi:hypothetical protein BG842_13975 [Haladaptatus sp. W1]|nr:hypothetical protein BG842_13975 [Haladaptatus sp. W1]